MASDKRFVLTRIGPGMGNALDLGGGKGDLSSALRRRGYAYVNIDLSPQGPGAVRGDAGRLPFGAARFALVVSSDSLEHFPDPGRAVAEAHRVLTPTGRFVIWVPFMHPFHGDDYYRYTPVGLHHLLEEGGFTIESLEAPLWVFSVLGQILVQGIRRVGLLALEPLVERSAAWLDLRLRRGRGSGLSFAAAYLVVARPCA